MELNKMVAEIIKNNADRINADDFTPVVWEALEKGVAVELLEAFNEAGIIPEHEQILGALKKCYLDRSTLPQDKKDEIERRLKHMANIESIMYMVFRFD